MTFLLLISVIILLLNKRLVLFFKEYTFCLPIFFAMMAFYFFSVIFITHPHYRYITPAFVLWELLFVIVITGTVRISGVRMTCYSVILLLFAVQCFVSSDPITSKIEKRLYTGKTWISNFSPHDNQNDKPMISDYILYNFQGLQWGEEMTEALRNMHLGDETLIMIPNIGRDDTMRAFGGETISKGILWDNRTERFSNALVKGGTRSHGGYITIPDGRIIVVTDLEEQMRQDYEHYYYLRLPYMSLNSDEELRAFENAGLWPIKTYTAVYGCWEMDVLQLVRQ